MHCATDAIVMDTNPNTFFVRAAFQTSALLFLSLVIASPVYAAQCCVSKPGTVALNTQIISDDLNKPWGMAFLPDGSILVTEKSGNLRRVLNGETSAAFSGVPEVRDGGQGGLLDIALDPDFENSSLIFLTFSEPEWGGLQSGTAVARARLDLQKGALRDVDIIFSMNKKSSGGRHFGSRIRFAADDTLFVTIGDRGAKNRAQDPFDHAGTVIRLNRDGSIPQDNPFADGVNALPEIWSIGHRNPQGAAIHPQTGKLWTLSHGAAGGDEINIPKAGRNYGWPQISYGTHYSGASFPRGASAEGMEQPVYYWDPSIAPSGFDFYFSDAPLIPDWNGSLFAGALKGRYLSRLILDGDTIVAEERYFEGELGRIRDVRSGPDGALWLLTDGPSGKLIRVTQQ
ncbi:MAG: PQQ-dependent sugar dehydrogenase [Pseudomonadota bacterium]